MRLIDWLDNGASLGGDRLCIVDGDTRLSYGEVVRETKRIAIELNRRGIGVGARVAAYGHNSAASLVAVLSIARSGATWIPASSRSTIAELIDILTGGTCAALLYDPALSAEAGELAAHVPSLRWVASFAELACLQDPTDLVDHGAPAPPEAEAILGFTGGTTGRPKGVVLSARNFEAMTLGLLASIDIGDPPIYLAAAPLTHAAGGLCFPVLAKGGTIVVQRTVDPVAILDAIEAHKISFLFLPPTAIYMLLNEPSALGRDYSSLRSFVYAAAPMAPERIRQAMELFGPVMAQLYGQSEAPMLCTVLTPSEHAVALRVASHRLASCGRPSLVARVVAMAEDGRILPVGEVGEIVVRGNLVMEGYLDDPEANAAVTAHGWHHTGDVGYRDPEGFIYLVDRKKDMIVTGGLNVFSNEVEQVVLAHPAVQQCAVVGSPDDKWGEIVTAVVEPRPGALVDPEELRNWCRDRLGPVRAPKRIEVWENLPRSSVGKVLKRDVRATFWAGRDRAI